ncbi:dephospho-CoA kinase [Reticulomyxa filosa]|uniref:Dephospho-CoA kinase n=1 Tax=Reticulomyxa filosa TaxID=46433 RepID=X6P8L0_RETFI|nr:dephospho-CoA kinase [Reticulomyxa filosa]|eukprot:ETO34448.1 dephospho-CoA kinase [Reticulomyxa filosa]
MTHIEYKRKVRTIGICGGIGSGKTTLCELLRNLKNVEIINADSIGHHVLKEPKTITKLCELFGEQNITTTNEVKVNESEELGITKVIDRVKLGNIVFSDKKKMEQLNQVMWPRIGDEMVSIWKEKTKPSQTKEEESTLFLFFEAAVLLEAQWHLQLNIWDELWVVCADKVKACARILKRNSHLSAEQASARIDAQMDNEKRIATAQDKKISSKVHIEVIWNNFDTIKEFQDVFNDIIEKMQKRAA